MKIQIQIQIQIQIRVYPEWRDSSTCLRMEFLGENFPGKMSERHYTLTIVRRKFKINFILIIVRKVTLLKLSGRKCFAELSFSE